LISPLKKMWLKAQSWADTLEFVTQVGKMEKGLEWGSRAGQSLSYHCWSPGVWRPQPATHQSLRAGLASSSSSHSIHGSSWMAMEQEQGLRLPFRASPTPHCLPLHIQASRPHSSAGTVPALAPSSPNRIMVQMLKWLHVLIKVDVHSEGCVCVMCGVEVGDGTRGQTQAS
jgi:hypothetical protein